MKTKFVLASVLALAVATPAFANMDMSKDDIKAKFNRADTDKDGKITSTEWKAAGWPTDKWNAVDANKDGNVTLEEKMAYHDTNKDMTKHN